MEAGEVQSSFWDTGDGVKCAGESFHAPNDTIKSAVVLDGVTDLSTVATSEWGGEIGVFQWCVELKSVQLPASLRRIGFNAFYGCEALTCIDIPSGVVEIGRWAFQWCESLQTVTIPEGVVDLPSQIFFECKSLKSVNLPSSLKTVGSHAFYKCSSLSTINFDALEGVAEIGNHAFYHCFSLTTFKLPPLLKTINAHTFHKCKRLSEVQLPPSLEKIEQWAFDGCHRDLSIDLPATLTSVCNNALRGCRIHLPPSLSLLFLANDGDGAKGLLRGVKEVVTSSRMNLELLVDHINSLPKWCRFRGETVAFLDPDLTIKILHGGSKKAAPTKIREHVPESVFCFEITAIHLVYVQKIFGDFKAIRAKFESKFGAMLSAFADILSRFSNAELPDALLYDILPFLWGDKVSKLILKDAIAQVAELLKHKRSRRPQDKGAMKTVQELEEKMKKLKMDGEAALSALSKENKELRAKIERLMAKQNIVVA